VFELTQHLFRTKIEPRKLYGKGIILKQISFLPLGKAKTKNNQKAKR